MKYKKMDPETKKNRLEVLAKIPELGIKLILKYNMYMLGNRLAMADSESSVSLIHSDITGIDKDDKTTDIISGNTKIVLWNNPRLGGFSVYM